MVYNFSAGPSVLPKEVLLQAQEEMLDWHGSGMSVMEMSHRGKEFTSIIETALSDFKTLFAVPDNYKVLFLQGGGIGENAIVPMNLIGRTGKADYVVGGSWSAKSAKEASRYGEVNIAASSADQRYVAIPDRASWTLSKDAAYVHICSNETIDGVEYPFDPDVAAETNGAPVVADMSSNILSRQVDVSKYGVIYAGAQKNIGMAGVVVTVVREDLLDDALPICPSAFNWRNVADNNSMFNTPPTYAIYIAGLVFQWLKRQGGIAEIEKRNAAKSQLLYQYLDQSEFYTTRIQPAYRSRMNIPFFLQDEGLNDMFLAGAKDRGLLQIKGHKSVGGMRASIYNAMPIEGVEALITYMTDFEKRYG